MFLYFIPLFILYYYSFKRYNVRRTMLILLILMLFLCFGYMTGSDWRNYEQNYYEGYLHRLFEPGYMWIATVSNELGLNFWVFHIVLKCFCFITTMNIFRLLLGKDKNFYFILMLWYASYGLFLYVNCPFRNLIACGISAIGFIFFFQKKWGMYYFFSLLAIMFHYSAVILLIFPLVRLEKISSFVLIILYFSLAIIVEIGGLSFLLSVMNAFVPPFLLDRMDFYTDDAVGSLFSIGLIPRLICLSLIIKYRKEISIKYRYGSSIFNLTYISLIFSLIYYIFPMLFRSALFLGPFYVIAIGIGISQITEQLKSKMKMLFLLIACAITFTTVRNVYYVPYSNILLNCMSGQFYDYTYRVDYNIKHSPYKDKK